MVNESHTKAAILGFLRSTSGPVTGEAMGRRLGISRVAVHKHMGGLKEAGYNLVVDHRGYRLCEENAMPFTSWEFGADEQVTVYTEVESTMDAAHRLAENRPDECFTLAALRQKAGRGRRGRFWSSPDGGLWITRVLRPSGSALRLQRYVMAAASVLTRCLRDTRGIGAVVKWPNDVLVEGKKIAGVLGEARLSGDRFVYLALGLGVNVGNIPGPHAAAIESITGHAEDRRQLLREWTAALDAFLAGNDFAGDDEPQWWNALMPSIGTRAAYRVDGKRITGVIAGADGLGRLQINTMAGGRISLSSGNIEEII